MARTAVFGLDGRGRILFCNRPAESLLGRPRERLAGSPPPLTGKGAGRRIRWAASADTMERHGRETASSPPLFLESLVSADPANDGRDDFCPGGLLIVPSRTPMNRDDEGEERKALARLMETALRSISLDAPPDHIVEALRVFTRADAALLEVPTPGGRLAPRGAAGKVGPCIGPTDLGTRSRRRSRSSLPASAVTGRCRLERGPEWRPSSAWRSGCRSGLRPLGGAGPPPSRPRWLSRASPDRAPSGAH